MCFGDRLLHITLARVWAALSSWEKVKLVWTLVHTGLSMPDKKQLAEELEAMKVTCTQMYSCSCAGWLFVCVGVCVYVHTYVCLSVCMCACTCVCVCVCVCILNVLVGPV